VGTAAPLILDRKVAGSLVCDRKRDARLERQVTTDSADEYRKKADECREQAERSISPIDKSAWLRIAEQWLKLAQETDAAQTKGR
jgi:hypothetical protein